MRRAWPVAAVLLLALVQAGAGVPAGAAGPARAEDLSAACFSIQVGTFANPDNALRYHARLLEALPREAGDQLRLEKIGKLHVLRIGRAATREDLAPLLGAVRSKVDNPRVMDVDFLPARFIIPPRAMSRAGSDRPAESGAGPARENVQAQAARPEGMPPVLPPAPEAATAIGRPEAAAQVPGSATPEVPPALAAEQEPLAPEVLDEPLPPLLPFGSTPREQKLIQARIATRTGHFPKGKKLYQQLLAEHPGDEEILEQYVDALVDAMEYELAGSLLADWLERDPDNPRPLRLLGLMFVRAGEYELSWTPFEDLLERDPGDIGTMADLGFAKLGGGDWQHALELFSGVAEEQPENEVAAQMVQELLIAHRPRLNAEYRTELRADDAVLSTMAGGFSSPLSDRLALDLRYDVIHVERPSKDTQERIGHTVQDGMLTVRAVVFEDLDAFLGLGAVDGVGSRLAQQAGLEWQVHRPGRILVLAERNRPWLDRVDATRFEGFQDHASLAYDALYDNLWGLYLSAERFRYKLLDEEYGRRNLGTARITRRLGWKPNLFAGYAYSFGSSGLEEDWPLVLVDGVLTRPIGLDEDEESHSWFLTMDERICRNVRLLLSGGAGHNTMSGGSAFYFGSGELLLEVSNRLTVRAGAGHNTDKSSVGGETTTYTTGIIWIF